MNALFKNRRVLLPLLILGIAFWQFSIFLGKDSLDSRFFIHANGYPTTGCVHIFLHLPEKWLGFEKPHGIMLGNQLYFFISLSVLFSSLWWSGRTILSFLVLLLMGSNSFLLYEVYGRENIFSWIVSSSMLLAGLFYAYFTFLKDWKHKYLLLFLVFSVIGFAGNIRGDCKVLLIPSLLLALYACFQQGKSYFVVLFLSLGLFLSFQQLPQAINYHYNGKWEKNYTDHPLWHPLWLGLGDYDNQYGHIFLDKVGYSYVRKKYSDQTGNDFGREIFSPGFNEIYRDGFLEQIKTNPIWYLEILLKRAFRIMSEYIQPSICAFRWNLAIPYPVLLNFLIVFFTLCYVFLKDKSLIPIFLILTFTSSTSFLIHSSAGMTNYTTIHLFCLAVAISVVLKVCFKK